MRVQDVAAEDSRKVSQKESLLLSVARLHEIFYLWRPTLPDPDDDMILELAVAAGCGCIITHNVADFRGSERLGIEAILPGDFLRRIGETP